MAWFGLTRYRILKILLRRPPAAAVPDLVEVPATDPPPATSPGDWGADYCRRPRVHLATPAIRELRGAGWSREDLAERFGVSVATIGRITRGCDGGQPLRSVTPDQAAEICARRARGERCKDLAAEFGVDVATVSRILKAGRLRPAPPPAADDDDLAAAEPQIAPELPPEPSPPAAVADGPEWKYFGGAAPVPRSGRTGRRNDP